MTVFGSEPSASTQCSESHPVGDGFFGWLKMESANRCRYQTRAEVRVHIFDYIERFHNPGWRRHSELLTENDAPLMGSSVDTG